MKKHESLLWKAEGQSSYGSPDQCLLSPRMLETSSLPKHVSAICGWSPLRHFTTGSQLEVTLHFIMEMFPFVMNTHLLIMFLLDWPRHKAGKYLPCKSNLESIRNRSEFWLLFSDHWQVAKEPPLSKSLETEVTPLYCSYSSNDLKHPSCQQRGCPEEGKKAGKVCAETPQPSGLRKRSRDELTALYNVPRRGSAKGGSGLFSE